MDLLPLAAEVPFKTGDTIKQAYQLQQQLGADFNHFAKFYQCGTHEDYKFVAMELLGPSFIQLASRHHPCRFNLHVLLKFGIQAIDALKQLHKAGFVHRDVKPDKFVIGNQQNTTGLIYLIDFGLCKKLHKENGVIAKPIQPSNFRGSLRYASPNAHKQIELGRSDDLISLFYLMIELFIGKLPWSNIANSDIVLQQKLIYRGRVLIQQMPKEFHSFEDYIFSLDYTDEPDYQLIINLFKTIAVNEGIDLSQPFDWENEINEQRSIVVQKQLEILKQRRKDQKINKNNLTNQITTKIQKQISERKAPIISAV
ncbi:MAG: putative Tau-tubulin kinase 1 [Streblomastix strix]|uniref:Putative Tau-tubulin kinase 1 n=1 Tax=Streblomastix strix TaxID=222440 RepID=A0A5J4UU06_9EUKA|nr:MAG: putative Tau-tubulin kinase 1 [Streblomastix strix]